MFDCFFPFSLSNRDRIFLNCTLLNAFASKAVEIATLLNNSRFVKNSLFFERLGEMTKDDERNSRLGHYRVEMT